MPRHRQKAGTRKGTILSRTRRQGKATRIRSFLARLAIVCAITVTLLWAGGWLYWSGTFERIGIASSEKFYKATAENGFYVRDVLVEGRKNADASVLIGLLNVDRGDPIFAFNPVSARTMLERETWIESARVERHLPDTVYVSITERIPFALWQYQGKVRLIDSKGFVITDVRAEMAKFQTLPLVVGEGAEKQAHALFNLMQAEPDIMARLDAATYVGERRWDLKLKGGALVRLPEDDMGLALRRLAEAQVTDRLLDKDLDSVDLREPNRIIVKTRPGMVQDYKASFNTAGDAI